MTTFGNFRQGSRAGHTSGVAGVDARRATPPDPRLPRRELAGCRQLDPSHPALVTCEDAQVERWPLVPAERVVPTICAPSLGDKRNWFKSPKSPSCPSCTKMTSCNHHGNNDLRDRPRATSLTDVCHRLSRCVTVCHRLSPVASDCYRSIPSTCPPVSGEASPKSLSPDLRIAARQDHILKHRRDEVKAAAIAVEDVARSRRRRPGSRA
jgi:hypothetical protein